MTAPRATEATIAKDRIGISVVEYEIMHRARSSS